MSAAPAVSFGRSSTRRLISRLRLGDKALLAFNACVYLFLFAPILIVIAISFNDTAYMSFPPKHLTLRWYYEIPRQSRFIGAFQTSLWLAAAVSLCSTLIGSLAAYGLVRYRFPGRDMMNSLVMSPLVLPGIVTGIAMLQFFTLLGGHGSFYRLLIGHVVITVPYVVRAVAAVLHGFDISMEEAAMNLGANRLRTAWYVTLPMLKSGLMAGAIFAFIMSFDNVVVSIFLTTPRIVTLPIVIYNFIEFSGRPIIASISTIQIVVIVALLYVTERMLGFSKYM